VLRPVLAGYDRMRRMVFLGSIMKTERMVKAMPLLSTLVASWWSILLMLSAVSQCRNVAQSLYLHVVCQRDLTVLVANNGELELAAGDLINVLDPAIVRVDRVGRETDELSTATAELGLQLCESSELGCAYWRVVLGMREKNDPVVADELVEVDRALGGLGLEVGGLATQAKRLWSVAHSVSAPMLARVLANCANMRGGGAGSKGPTYLLVWFTFWSELAKDGRVSCICTIAMLKQCYEGGKKLWGR
jgi:hypothetical protein